MKNHVKTFRLGYLNCMYGLEACIKSHPFWGVYHITWCRMQIIDQHFYHMVHIQIIDQNHVECNRLLLYKFIHDGSFDRIRVANAGTPHSFPPSSLDRRCFEFIVSPKKVVGCRGGNQNVEGISLLSAN